jgi:hypothetical protein
MFIPDRVDKFIINALRLIGAFEQLTADGPEEGVPLHTYVELPFCIAMIELAP